MNGILVVNKEKGYTSRDVVNKVSFLLGTKKVGHTGTLDPLATGVLVLGVGEGLKLAELLTDHDKEYIAKVRLGVMTDTLDVTGSVLEERASVMVSEDEVRQVLKQFVGHIKQEVPKYSAVKVKGKKLYEYARAGEEVTLPIREVEISQLELVSEISQNEFWIHCSVSKGTYIRSLIRDIGLALKTGAVMVELNRTRVGKFLLEDAFSLDEISQGHYKLLSPVEVIDLPKIVMNQELEKKVRNGQVLDKFFSEDLVMLLDSKGTLVAIYQKYGENKAKPYRMFL